MRAGIAALALVCALFATEPNAATKRWWSHVKALGNDGLQGRDTGSEGYRKAAAYVVEQFQRAGLKPAGDNGGWYQTVPLRALRLRTDRSEISLVRKDGAVKRLELLRNATVTARAGLPEQIDAPLIFEGAGSADDP